MLQQVAPTAKTPTRRAAEAPTYIAGDFAALSACEWMLTTERGMYRIEMNSYSGLSITEKRWATVRTAEGQQIIDFGYIRKHLKAGLRCNVTGFGGWDNEAACIEAMTRHYVARFEARLEAAKDKAAAINKRPAAPRLGNALGARLHQLIGTVMSLDSAIDRFAFASLNLGYEVKSFAALTYDEAEQLLAMVQVAASRRLGVGLVA